MRSEPTSRFEFVAVMAALISTAAFSTDSMLPALPAIGHELTPGSPNDAEFVVTAFIVGLGLGTLVVGPLSDTLGRKPVLFGAAVLAVGGALASFAAPSMEFLIAARLLHGLGAAGARALAVAIIRDLYVGRRMAQTMSFVMTVFALVPAIAPLTGSFIEAAMGWRAIFIFLGLWAVIANTWLLLRQPETLPPERRSPFRPTTILEGLGEIFGNRSVVTSILALSLVRAILFTMIVSVQPIFNITFDRAASFPWWFALTAVIGMSGPILNASLVVRLGMRSMASAAFAVQAVFAGTMALSSDLGLWPHALYFPAFYVWMTSIFWMMGLTIANLSALALEPLDRHVGLAASVVNATGTTLGALIAIPIGLAFDGTPVPAMTGVFLCALVALLLLRSMPKEPAEETDTEAHAAAKPVSS